MATLVVRYRERLKSTNKPTYNIPLNKPKFVLYE